MNKIIDLRSDTVTKPSEKMRLAMYRAEVGDDVYGDDPTVNRLEELGAELFGKEAALFVTSGTQGNLLALLTHCRRGDEVIVEANSHIFLYEVGGLSALGGIMPRCIPGDNGFLIPESVENSIRSENVHHPITRLICVENTHNLAGGAVITIEQQNALRQVADNYQLKMHLDGARAFNAAVFLGCPVAEVAQPYDSVQVCLSKGLGAPVGSLLVGKKDFIAQARRYRKMVGGGMRQAGVIAAAGIYALENMVERLADDHHNAKLLAEKVANVKGLGLDMRSVDTNIVYCKVDEDYMSAVELCDKLREKGVLANAMGSDRVRFVTHHDVTTEQCQQAAGIINEIMMADR